MGARSATVALIGPGSGGTIAEALGGRQPFHGGADMRIDVRLGTGLSRIAGGPRLAVDVVDGATVDDVLARIAEERPAIAAGLPSALTVVRGTQVDGGRVLAEGEEVAVLTPVAGG